MSGFLIVQRVIDPQPVEAARLRLAWEPGWAARTWSANTKSSFREDL